MGTLIGHVVPGFGFLLIGLWHLYNHTKLHSLRPSSYKSLSWFPSPKLRRLELLLIIVGSSLSIAMELFIGPRNHQPLDPSDFTIPSDHLHNFEHASISLTFLIYASFAFLFDLSRDPHESRDRLRSRDSYPMTQLLAAVAFAQQLLMFHLHSADHMGVEGRYHWLLQLVIVVSLSTTLIGIGLPRSFHVSFVRSVSIMFQGVWFIVMGYVLWTPGLVFKGCFMNPEDGHTVVRCRGEAALERAKSIVNLQFSWFMAGVVVFSVVFYLWVSKLYPEEPEYVPVGSWGSGSGSGSGSDEEDLEGQKKFGESESFVHIEKGMRSIDLER